MAYEGRSNAYDGEEIEREANADESHSSQCTLYIVSSSTTHTHTMWDSFFKIQDSRFKIWVLTCSREDKRRWVVKKWVELSERKVLNLSETEPRWSTVFTTAFAAYSFNVSITLPSSSLIKFIRHKTHWLVKYNQELEISTFLCVLLCHKMFRSTQQLSITVSANSLSPKKMRKTTEQKMNLEWRKNHNLIDQNMFEERKNDQNLESFWELKSLFHEEFVLIRRLMKNDC